MKKLNRKGFTLIELLAVIVILAIILVVTVPNIINSISDARVSSIHNLAVSVANTYDTVAAQDLISNDKRLDGITVTKNWACISADLAEILGLSDNDVVIGTTTNDAFSGSTMTEGNIATTTCSAIRVNTAGAAEVLLVAEDGGKFHVAGNVTYALSSKDTGVSEAR